MHFPLIEIENGSYDNSRCPYCMRSGITYDHQEPAGTGFTSAGTTFSATLFIGTCQYCGESYRDVTINVFEKSETSSELVFYYRGGNNIVPPRWLTKATPDVTTHYLGPFQNVSEFYHADGVTTHKVVWDVKAHARWLVSSILSIIYLNIDPDREEENLPDDPNAPF